MPPSWFERQLPQQFLTPHPSPAVALLSEVWDVAACVGATQSVSVQMDPRHLKTLPAEAFDLTRRVRSGSLPHGLAAAKAVI